MKLRYRPAALRKCAEYIWEHNEYARKYPDIEQFEKMILEMVRKDFQHVWALHLEEYHSGTMGFYYNIYSTRDDYGVDFYVNPALFTNDYSEKTL